MSMLEDRARVQHRTGMLELMFVALMISALIILAVMSASGIADALGKAANPAEQTEG
jgi:hypothetical protein